MADDDAGASPVATLFDTLAEVYDQSGVVFFGPVGERLVSLLDPQPGERCLDVGCGRGAVTMPLAQAVGPGGRVDALDVAPAMVAETRALVDAAGLGHVTTAVADAADLGDRESGYDVVASSLVLFFLADPASALRTWVERLAPGGRIGLTTFGVLDEASRAIDDLLLPHAPPMMRDPRTTGIQSPFASEAGMEALLADAGARDVRTVVVPATVEFPDVAAWERFAMGTGQRAMLVRVPEDERPALLDQVGDILERTREGTGPGRLVWQMRYTLGRR